MDGDRFDILVRSIFAVSRRQGLLAGASAVFAAGLAALGVGDGEAKKKKKKCSAGDLRCGNKCCGQGFACQKGKKKKGKKPKKTCASVCPANGGACGGTVCGNGGPGSVCRATVTTEGESFCLDFAKANPVACQSVCRRSEDCGPGGVCVCVNNPPSCSCGEGVETSCFVRADVECE